MNTTIKITLFFFLTFLLIGFASKHLIKDYWVNFDCTFFGKKWGNDLASYLEENMKDIECDHTFKSTNEFFSKRLFIKKIFHLWLYTQYSCDCEVLINTTWREDLDWRSKPPEFKVNSLDQYLTYKDGTKLDLRLYKNGLKEKNILKLLQDKHITDLNEEILMTLPKGTLFTVLPMDFSIGYFGRVHLLSLDGSVQSLYFDDDEKIFEEFEIIDSVKYYQNKIENQKKENKESSSLYKSLAVAFKNENNFELTIQYFKKAVDVAIKNTDIHSGSTFLAKKDLANEYFGQGKYALAIDGFQEALKLNTEDSTYKDYVQNFNDKIKFAKRMLRK